MYRASTRRMYITPLSSIYRASIDDLSSIHRPSIEHLSNTHPANSYCRPIPNQSTARPNSTTRLLHDSNPHLCRKTYTHTAWGEQKPTGGGPERMRVHGHMVFLSGKSFDPDSILLAPRANLQTCHKQGVPIGFGWKREVQFLILSRTTLNDDGSAYIHKLTPKTAGHDASGSNHQVSNPRKPPHRWPQFPTPHRWPR